MFRQTYTSIRLFLNLFQAAPPVPPRLLLSGGAAIAALPVMVALMGMHNFDTAFVTAIAIGLALRLGLRLESMIPRLAASHGAAATGALVLPLVLLPLAVILWLDNPLLCQHLPSLYYLVIGALFLSDVIGGREDMAALFWPWEDMQPHLPALTRVMVLFHMTFLLLNETVIRVAAPTGWLLFWAVLPVLGHVVMGALILTVVDGAGDDPAGT